MIVRKDEHLIAFYHSEGRGMMTELTHPSMIPGLEQLMQSEQEVIHVLNISNVEHSARYNPVQRRYLPTLQETAAFAGRMIDMFWQNAEGAPRYFQLYKEASKDIFTACLWFFMNYQDGRYSDLPHVMAFLNHDYKEIFEVLATEPEIRDMITSLVRVYRNKDFELLDFAMLPLQTMLNKLRTPEICWLLHKDGDDFKTRRGDGNWLMVIARDTQQTLLDLITTMIAGAPPTKNTKSWMDCEMPWQAFKTIQESDFAKPYVFTNEDSRDRILKINQTKVHEDVNEMIYELVKNNLHETKGK